MSLKAGKEQRLPGPFSDELVREGPMTSQTKVFAVGPDLQQKNIFVVLTFEEEELLGKAFNQLSCTSNCVKQTVDETRETHLNTCDLCRFVKAGNSLAG